METETRENIKAGMKQELVVKEIKNIPEVEEIPIKVYEKDTKYKAIVQKENKKTLSVVGINYQLKQHKEIYEYISKLKDYQICYAEVFKNGKILMIEMIKKDEKEQKHELLPGDFYLRKLRIFNSYDESYALSVQAYGLRLVCKNGMVAPGYTTRFKKVHTFKNINLEDLEKYIELADNAWKESEQVLQKANITKIDVDTTIVKYLKYFPKKYIDLIRGKVKTVDTVYNLWNAVTNVVTYNMAPRLRTNTLVEYQRLANKVIQSINDPECEPVMKGSKPKSEGK